MKANVTPPSTLLGRSLAVAAPAEALAVLCLAADFGAAEQHLLRLCAALRGGGQRVLLVAAADSPLATQATDRLPVLPLPGPTLRRVPRAAWVLARWLHRQRIGTLLVTRAADLALASAAKVLRRGRLRVVFQQHEPLAQAAPATWWARLCRRSLNAWLAPLPSVARQVEARTGLEGRQLWVLPPGAAPAAAVGPVSARRLLNLPLAAPLLGVVDEGDNAAFALEVLHRLRTELGLRASLVVASSPGAPADAGRWQQLRGLAQGLHLAAHVHLRPFQPADPEGLFFPALDVLLSPAPCTDYDPMLQAALAAGCPVVAAAGSAAVDYAGALTCYCPTDLAECTYLVAEVLRATPPARRPVAPLLTVEQESQLLLDILHFLEA